MSSYTRQDMECRECGIDIRYEVHENYICFDCFCELDMKFHEEEIQKKTSVEEE